MSSVTKARQIRRKDSIPSDDQTPGKEQAADYIEREVLEKDRWPMNLTDIADECEWSRQHIANTLRDYFEPAPPNRAPVQVNATGEKEPPATQINIKVPEGVDVDSYLQGWVDGYKRGKRQ